MDPGEFWARRYETALLAYMYGNKPRLTNMHYPRVYGKQVSTEVLLDCSGDGPWPVPDDYENRYGIQCNVRGLCL